MAEGQLLTQIDAAERLSAGRLAALGAAAFDDMAPIRASQVAMADAATTLRAAQIASREASIPR
ncbi:MAG: hypothetical protein NTW56_11490 [Alphaproteobacteria bacterium]|nr:hypothetical protein [Alphaproteobacteria bacterium]